MGRLPHQQTVIKIVLGATIALVACLAWESFNDPEAMWAPGNLSSSHAAITSCTQCHVPFQGPSAAKCIACHSEEWFRRALMPEVGQRHVMAVHEQRSCLTCHTEHQGGL